MSARRKVGVGMELGVVGELRGVVLVAEVWVLGCVWGAMACCR
jgi:hypothetical protein